MKIIALIVVVIQVTLTAGMAQSLTASERRSLIIASQRYPDLQSADTLHAKAFEKLLNQAIETKSVVFRDSNWPIIIAEKAQQSLPTLQQGRRSIGRLPIEKYEDALADMLKSKNPKMQHYAQLERAAHQAELAGDTRTAANLRAQQAQLQALGRIEQKLEQIEMDIFRVKQQIGIP
jgi:hypothetical protein